MSQKGIGGIVLLLIVFIISAGGFFAFQIINNKSNNSSDKVFKATDIKKSQGKDNPFNREYSAGRCQGEGTTTFTHPPLKIEDIGQVEPYGIMVDAHVIPTSHGYISPKEFRSERDKYPVYAVADGYIVSVSHRGEFVGDHQKGRPTDEYQMYFEHSCTFYTYYDLLTSLSPEIEKEVGNQTESHWNKRVRIPVKAGQLVGRVGGQTVDFAVWNFEKEPAYFANPKNYTHDEDRFYLDDMFAYFEEPIRSQLLSKNLRTAEPRTGKVAYDKEGKVIGNWFKEGTGGFEGPKETMGQPGRRYWDGHLSISYHYIEADKIVFSIGNFNGKASQFSIRGNGPDPATIDMSSGPVKYELIPMGSQYSSEGGIAGTALLQLVEPAKLKLELFPERSADQVKGFTYNSQIYER